MGKATWNAPGRHHVAGRTDKRHGAGWVQSCKEVTGWGGRRVTKLGLSPLPIIPYQDFRNVQ